LKIKLTAHHFDTVEVIEAESQEVLNTLIEHYFQEAFKQIAEELGTVHMHGRGLLWGVMVASRPKGSF
jgi:predicted helicase